MANASLNLEKCHFGCTKGILLGHMISQDGSHTNCAKIEKVKIFLFPRQRDNCKHFWGKWVITKGSSRGMQPRHITSPNFSNIGQRFWRKKR